MTNDDAQFRRLIDVTVYLMTVLGTLAFALGRESIVLPAISVLSGALAYWLSTKREHFHLHRYLVNALILVIAAAMLVRLLKASADLQYASLADGFVFLQCVLSFERRTLRTWWDLMTLSFALLFVAGQLPQGPSFALVMLAYFFCALAAMAEIHIYTQRTRWRSVEPESSLAANAARTPSPTPKTDWWRVAKVAVSTLMVGPFSLFMRFRDPLREDHQDDTWSPDRRLRPLPDRPDGAAVAAAGVRIDLGAEFWRRIARITLVSLGVASVVFLLTPRFGRFEFNLAEFRRMMWGEDDSEGPRSVGYRDAVELGELGAALKSPEKALTVQFSDFDGTRVKVKGDVYLRGAVLTLYDDGHWEHRRYNAFAVYPDLRRRRDLPTSGLIRQRVSMEPMDHTGIFSVWPPVYTDRTDDIWFDEQAERFRRPGDRRKSPFVYELGTSGFVRGNQVSLTPCEARVYTQALLAYPEDDLPELVRLAGQWITESRISSDDPAGRAEYLARRFVNSSRFSYTLNEQDRDPALDPVEDFVAHHPLGNCEYFATALALMLRSQKIPARVVVGYRSDALGYFDEGYIVRQEHAHSWVEAYIPPDKCEQIENRTLALADWQHGGWLRLDPTPASSGVFAGLLGQGVEDWVMRLRSFWANRIVGMTGRQHRDIVYGAAIGSLKDLARTVFSPDWWSALYERTTIAEDPSVLQRTKTRDWLIWYGTLAGLAVVLGLGLATWKLRLFTRMRGQSPKPAASPRRAATAIDVPFYQRWESLLNRLGLYRRPQQTPHEFAREVGRQLSEKTGDTCATDWGIQVAEAYYLVRYGRRELNTSQLAAIGETLQLLEQATT